MTENRYELVVGLETHVELKTRTKAFCGCENRYGAPPNTLVCPVCMGLPGTLPVLNRRAMELAALAGFALNCRVNPISSCFLPRRVLVCMKHRPFYRGKVLWCGFLVSSLVYNSAHVKKRKSETLYFIA